jgi:hypothetical protein
MMWLSRSGHIHSPETERIRMTLFRFFTVRLLAVSLLPLVLMGCPPQVDRGPGSAPENSEQTAKNVKTPEKMATEPATPTTNADLAKDDPAAVKALTDAGVAFVLNPQGQVTSADAKNASLTDEQVQNFKSFSQLKVLSLENAQMTDEGLKILASLPQLEELSLRRCTNITDAGLAALKFVPRLQRLLLLFTRTSNDGLAPVGQLKELKLLDLRGCSRIGDEGLAHLKDLTKLVDLKVESYSVSDAGMKSLSGMTSLRALWLKDCGIDDEGMPALEGLKQLASLNLSRTTVGDAGLASLKDMPLKTLLLRDTAVTGTGLDHLSAAKSTLSVLDLSETLIGNDGISHIVPFTTIKVLDLWNGSLDDEGVGLLTKLADLEDLNLEGCRDVTSASADHFLKLKALKSLNLAETSFDDSGLKKLTGLESLKQLNLGRCNVTDEGVSNFEKSRPGVTIKR